MDEKIIEKNGEKYKVAQIHQSVDGTVIELIPVGDSNRVILSRLTA